MDGFQLSTLVQQTSKFIVDGGVFMYVILAVWGLGIALCFERFSKLMFRFDVDGPSFMNELQRYVLSNDVQGAIRICSGSNAMLPRVLKSGLKRANLGADQIQNAMDATILEVVPKIEKNIGLLGTLANISTLFGLLGTIQGLIMSFSAVAEADPAQKAEVLAVGISVAMNTTGLGLLSAISILIFQAVINVKSDKIVAEIDEFSAKLIDLLGTKNLKESDL